MGTQFTLYDNGNNPNKGVFDDRLRRELIAITYDTNILGFKGPRKMSVIMPGMSLDHQRVEIRPRSVRAYYYLFILSLLSVSFNMILNT